MNEQSLIKTIVYSLNQLYFNEWSNFYNLQPPKIPNNFQSRIIRFLFFIYFLTIEGMKKNKKYQKLWELFF